MKFRKERRRQCGTTIRYLTECPGDDVEYEDCQKGIHTWRIIEMIIVYLMNIDKSKVLD